jgi:signal transduction histidine kinase
MVVFACVSAVAATQWAFDRQLLADVVLLVVLYTVAAYRDLRLALIALGVVEVGVLLAVVRWTKSGGAGAFVDAFVLLSSLATAAYVLGRNVRNRRAYLASVEDRARRAEFERDQQAQLAAAAERARIAREMHDIVTHNLSVMIALADGAAFAVHQNPTAAEGAVRQVSATGRQALGEMHRLLGVLRGNETEAMRAPQPGIEQLDALAEQVRSAGLPTSLTMTGTPFPVSPTAGLAVYRVVQEALTNVLKHARSPTQAKVTVQFQEPVIQVEIDDDGVGGVRSVAPGGHGLDGMAERVTMFDGSVHAGPRPDGGWRVSAILASGGVAS